MYREEIGEDRGFTIWREIDDFPIDLDEIREGSMFTMYCTHRRYDLGDVQIKSREDFLERITGMYSDEVSIEAMEREADRVTLVLPLYLYDHSGLSMSTGAFSCPWDSGQVGWIVANKERVKREMGWDRLSRKRIEKVLDMMIGEVKTYDAVLRGEVYCYGIDDADGEEIDSVGMVIGDDDFYVQEAKGIIDSELIEREERYIEDFSRLLRAAI